MSNFLSPQTGVSMSGVFWDIGPFKLWQSTSPGVVLFTPKQPTLALGPDGRYQVAVSSYRQQQDGTYKITGGAAAFTVTTALQYDPAAMDRLKEEWRRHLREQNGPTNPIFVPLNARKAEAVVLMGAQSGKPHAEHNNRDAGTPGGSNSFLIELTALGAQEWSQAIRNHTNVPADVKLSFEYLRMLPLIGARVKLSGSKVFEHFSVSANASVTAGWYGGSAKVDAAWEEMRRSTAVTVELDGVADTPELEKLRNELVTTFLKQAQQQWDKLLFEPAPNVDAAQAGNTGGIFGGANVAFKYKKASDLVDQELNLQFRGLTWLKASMDTTVGALFSPLDDSYVTDVNQELSFPSTVVVDADDQVEQVAVSWSASEGHGPESPVFDGKGGIQSYIVTAKDPDAVKVKYTAKVNFGPPSWPIIEQSGELTEKTLVIKPSSWIGRNYIYLFIRDGNGIKLDNIERDYLVCNVSYTGAHLKAPIKASARITPDMPLEFTYPLSSTRERGIVKFSAFGVIGGQLVQSREQTISVDEEAVFLLADQKTVTAVSRSAVMPESDSLAQNLMAAAGRPVIVDRNAETTRGNGNGNGANGSTLRGTVIASEYGMYGPALWLRDAAGKDRRIGLHDPREGLRFGRSPLRAIVTLDAQAMADRIEIEL
jgi:hypothetical protein